VSEVLLNAVVENEQHHFALVPSSTVQWATAHLQIFSQCSLRKLKNESILKVQIVLELQ